MIKQKYGYKIIDCQIIGREFANGAIFKDEEEVRKQLVDYHMSDWAEKPSLLKNMKLNEVLEYGQWKLRKVKI